MRKKQEPSKTERPKVCVVKAFRLFYLVPMLPRQVGYFYRCGMDLLPIVLRLPVLVHPLNLTEKRQTRIAAVSVLQSDKITISKILFAKCCLELFIALQRIEFTKLVKVPNVYFSG